MQIGVILHANKASKDALSQVRKFFNVSNLLSLFSFNFHLEICVILHFNKLEFISPKDALSQVWLKLAQWFLERRFVNDGNHFSPFCYFLLLEKIVVLHFKKRQFPSLKDALCQVWLKLAL